MWYWLLLSLIMKQCEFWWKIFAKTLFFKNNYDYMKWFKLFVNEFNFSSVLLLAVLIVILVWVCIYLQRRYDFFPNNFKKHSFTKYVLLLSTKINHIAKEIWYNFFLVLKYYFRKWKKLRFKILAVL